MHNPDVLVNGCFVECFVADGAVGVVVGLLVFGHEAGGVLQSDVPRQAGGVDENLSAKIALLGRL